MIQNQSYLKAVPKRGMVKSFNKPQNLVDMLQSVSKAKQELYELLENTEILEEEIKQALYIQQGTRKK